MSRSKKIYALLGVLLVLCLAVFGVSRYEERKEQIKNSDEIILEVADDQVSSLSWEYEGENGKETLAFHKDNGWIYDEDEAFPVDEEKMAALLEQFEQFGVSFIIENVEDFGQYGLDDPICTIELGTEDKTYEILLGDYSTMDSQRYVSIGDGNVYLVKHDPFEDFEITIRDMILHDKIPEFSDADEIQFEGAENYSVTYEEESKNTYNAKDVYFTLLDGSTLPLDTVNVNSYLQTVQGLGLTDYVSYNVSEEELAKYGLDDPELAVTVQYTAEDTDDGSKDSEDGGQSGTFTLYVSRDAETKKTDAVLTDDGEEKPENADDEENAETEDSEAEEEVPAYVRIGESKIIYQIPESSYKALMDASYNTLRHQEILPADLNDITQFDITLEGMDYTITSETEDEETTWYYQEKEVETADLESAVSLLLADGFTDEEPSQKQEVALTVHLNNENFPEVRIEFYRYDGERCLAVVDGKPLAFVARSSVVDLMEAVNGIVLN